MIVEKILLKNRIPFTVVETPTFPLGKGAQSVRSKRFKSTDEIVSFFNKHRNPYILGKWKMEQEDGTLLVRYYSEDK